MAAGSAAGFAARRTERKGGGRTGVREKWPPVAASRTVLPRLLQPIPAAEAPLECRRRRHRRHHHHDKHRREDSLVDDPFAHYRQPQADVREDEADLTTRDHADADRQPVEPPTDRAERTRLLAGDGREREEAREAEHL